MSPAHQTACTGCGEKPCLSKTDMPVFTQCHDAGVKSPTTEP